ncbi:hypothetical protein BC830DRAFT_1260985 [Chytriomyces sp. MP71]|nr:hypothetical protein BC830DRAFT_1260985 [Chytriomyces sp. MP71]
MQLIANIFSLLLLCPGVFSRPHKPSICDKYTVALFKDNTEANQFALLTALVNTAVIGNYSATVNNVAVPGILAPGTYQGTQVSLVGYFNGALKTTNVNNKPGRTNFLDGGGAEPLKLNMLPAPNSNQRGLLLHLYQLFGVLLGCSKQGGSTLGMYQGDASLHETHKFMKINRAQFGYFVDQVVASALSFGVDEEDAEVVRGALNNIFGFRNPKPYSLEAGLPAKDQSICIASSCPRAY